MEDRVFSDNEGVELDEGGVGLRRVGGRILGKWDHGERCLANPGRYRMRQMEEQRALDRAHYVNNGNDPLDFVPLINFKGYVPGEHRRLGYMRIVYFILIRALGHVKIGVTTKLEQRLKDLQVANSLPLEVLVTFPGGHAVEKRLHELFLEDHIRGEWFNYSDNIKNFLEWKVV